MKKFFIEKFLPLRLRIPFLTRSLIFIGDPKHIDEIKACNSIHHGLVEEPMLPFYIRGQANFKLSTCPFKNQFFVAGVDPSYDKAFTSYRKERLAYHSSFPMASEECVNVLSDYLCGKKDEKDAYYELICYMASNFTDLAPPKDIVELGLMKSKRWRSPWHYIQAEKARNKIILWCIEASKQTKNIPQGVDEEAFKECIAADIQHAVGAHFTGNTTWTAIKQLKKKFQSKKVDQSAEEIVKEILLSSKVLPMLPLVVKEACKLSFLSYELKPGDTLFLLLSIAKIKADDLQYAFLKCCLRKYIVNLMVRGIEKAEKSI